MLTRKVTIYTTPTCTFCVQAKDFLRTKGIQFEEKDVADDVTARQEMLEASGQLGVPVISVDSDVVIGFNKTILESLLTEN